MYTGKILVYQNKFNLDLDLDAIKSQISATEIKEADSDLVSYINKGYISIESIYCLEGYNVYQVDNSASSKMIQYSGCLVGALEFDRQSWVDFISYIDKMTEFNEFKYLFDCKMDYFLYESISHYWGDEFLSPFTEKFKVNLVDIFHPPNDIANFIKNIHCHLSNKW